MQSFLQKKFIFFCSVQISGVLGFGFTDSFTHFLGVTFSNLLIYKIENQILIHILTVVPSPIILGNFFKPTRFL
jgi:hypothetical protein